MLHVRLRHLHLVGLTSYEKASRLQSAAVDYHIKNKLKNYKNVKPNCSNTAPEVITFQTPPTYTCGRREIGKLSPEQIQHLRAGGSAEFHEAQRGGQTTFHGPGQLTAYTICTLPQHGLSPRQFIHLLEESVIRTCKDYGIDGERTDNPGLWTRRGDKIASVGVHVQRYVTSHGIALNISPDLDWFDRIVACGLPEKRATSFEKEGIIGVEVDSVAKVYAQNLARILPGVIGMSDLDGNG